MPWLSGYTRRKSKVVNNQQTDYQMSITIYKYGAGPDSPTQIYLGGHCRDDFGDIRFTGPDQTTIFNYWIESYVSGNYAIFWFKTPSIPLNPNNIYIYYDNPSASSLSNGPNTFIIYDDFNSNTISDWVQVQGTQYFIAQNQRMEHTTGYNPFPYWGAIVKGGSTANTPKFVMEYTANTLASGCQRGYGWMIWSDSSHYFGYCSVGGTGCGNATQNKGYSITFNQQSYLTASEKKAQVIYDGGRLKTYFDGTLYWDFTVYLNANNRFGFYEQESGIGSENPCYYDTFRIRNYAIPEPSLGTLTTEELNITAIDPFTLSTNTCIGPCSITAGVTWRNYGNNGVTFRPAVLIDSTTIAYGTTDLTISAGGTGYGLVTTPTLSAGAHTICPYPN